MPLPHRPVNAMASLGSRTRSSTSSAGLLLLLGLLGAPLAACGGEDEAISGPERPGRADAGTDTGGRPRPGEGPEPGGLDATDRDTDDEGDATAEPVDDASSPADVQDGPTPDAALPPDTTPDPRPDTGPGPSPGDPCDRDGDGYQAVSCGGNDCDDTNPSVFPGAPESCDYVDQDCDGVINNGVECLIYAHTSSQLFLVDPFLGNVTLVTSTPGNMFDFDTSPDGRLYGIAGQSLYVFEPASSRWDVVGSFGSLGITPNGFAIDSAGDGWITGGTRVYRMDLSNGSTTRVTDNSGYTSSGDCVVDKGDVLYMSATGGFTGGDRLVEIDGGTGRTTLIGNIGFSNVYGLASAWGILFGFTSQGELIEIDPATGQGTLRHRLRDSAGRSPVWYGSASSPGR